MSIIVHLCNGTSILIIRNRIEVIFITLSEWKLTGWTMWAGFLSHPGPDQRPGSRVITFWTNSNGYLINCAFVHRLPLAVIGKQCNI